MFRSLSSYAYLFRLVYASSLRGSPKVTRRRFRCPAAAQTLRETIEAAIIVSVLLGLVESLVHDKAANAEKDAVERLGDDEKKKIIRRMRMQIWAGAIVGKSTRAHFTFFGLPR